MGECVGAAVSCRLCAYVYGVFTVHMWRLLGMCVCVLHAWAANPDWWQGVFRERTSTC
jgi:hypothetical protein